MAQVGECSWDSPVTPIPVLGGHADHQPLDLVPSARTAWVALLAAIVLRGDQPAAPGQQLPATRWWSIPAADASPISWLDRQAQALVVAQAQPLASELFTQDPVLFLTVIEGILLPLVHPASKGNQ